MIKLEELRAALAAMEMRAKTAEAYLEQAEQRIAELEAELTTLEERPEPMSAEEMYRKAMQGHQWTDEERERFEDRTPQSDYRPKKLPDAADKLERSKTYEAMQRWMAAQGGAPKLKKEAEKYLNEFLDNYPVGDGGKPQQDYAGNAYRMIADGWRPGKVQFQVYRKDLNLSYAWEFDDNVEFDDFTRTVDGIIPSLMADLKMTGLGPTLKKDFILCMAKIRNGSANHTISRGGI